MPLVSGWALRPLQAYLCHLHTGGGFYALGIGLGIATVQKTIDKLRSYGLGFYALGIGLGIATRRSTNRCNTENTVSMPLVSGWALRREDRRFPLYSFQAVCFYALGIGLGIATATIDLETAELALATVSMPLVSGWALRLPSKPGQLGHNHLSHGFYALGIGLGIATDVLGRCP